MWLDDDGEDDPTPGPVPDPAERAWRHPSEIAAERAMAAANAAEPVDVQSTGAKTVTATAGGPSMLWPIAVVGGSIAVAAFGVLGLYSMGAPSSTRLAVGGTAISPAEEALATTATQAQSLNAPTTVEALAPLSKGDDEESGALLGGKDLAATTTLLYPQIKDEAVSTTSLLAGSDGTSASSPVDEDDSLADHSADSSARASDSNDSVDSDLAGSQPRGPNPVPTPEIDPDVLGDGAESLLRSVESSLSYFAVYDAPSPATEALASLLVVDSRLLTSAAAVGDRTSIWLRVGSEFHKATVAGRDALSDVAVIQLNDEAGGLELPTANLATPTTGKLRVSVGYCAIDKPSHERLDEWPSWCEMAEPDQVDSTPEPSPGEGSTLDRLRGQAYPTNTPGITFSDHTVYAPIKTDIRWTVEMSGAPLRDEDGRIVGMVAGGTGQYVFAVPIERVLSVAESLIDRGTGSLAWIGIETSRADDGLLIESISAKSPMVDKLQTGDVLVAVDGEPLQGLDHLIHLVREAGVGATMRISVITEDGTQEFEVEIIEVPPVE